MRRRAEGVGGGSAHHDGADLDITSGLHVIEVEKYILVLDRILRYERFARGKTAQRRRR